MHSSQPLSGNLFHVRNDMLNTRLPCFPNRVFCTRISWLTDTCRLFFWWLCSLIFMFCFCHSWQFSTWNLNVSILVTWIGFNLNISLDCSLTECIEKKNGTFVITRLCENSFIPEEVRTQGTENTRGRYKYIFNMARGVFHKPPKSDKHATRARLERSKLHDHE